MKYEVLHQAVKPVQSNNPFFIRKENGDVEKRFLSAPLEKIDVTVFPTQMAMLQPISYLDEKGLEIKAFREDGKPCYEGKSPFGHIWWDICHCDECTKEAIYDDDILPRRRKKKSTQQIFKERYGAGDPEVNLVGEPSRKFDYYVLYPRTKKQKTQSSPGKETIPKEDHDQKLKPPLIPYYHEVLPQLPRYQPLPSSQTQTQKPLSCYMFDCASPSYSQDFPPLKCFEHP